MRTELHGVAVQIEQGVRPCRVHAAASAGQQSAVAKVPGLQSMHLGAAIL